ncbi:MAG: HD domain-containing protein [archaeon]
MEDKALLKLCPASSEKKIREAITMLSERMKDEQKADHSIRAATILAEKNLGESAIIACLLRKPLKEEKTSAAEIEERFGKEAAVLAGEANEIIKVLHANYSKVPAETLSSLMLSMSTDFQTIMIIIANAMDYLKNPSAQSPEEGKRLAMITKEVYVPISMKLGIGGTDWFLQDYAFRIENPEGYEKIKKLVNKSRAERELLVEEVRKEVEGLIKGKITAQVFGRPKGFRAIHEKLKKTPFRQMHDLYGIRIICDKEKDCYEILGYVHAKYEIIPEAFDDYIAKPKSNGYKSIHTAVKRGNDTIEFQIRTWAHHMATESSLYWEYKRLKKNKDIDKELSWERQLVEWQKSVGAEIGRKKMGGKRIFVFTPRNEIITLPIGATALDFAFAVHTDIGKRAEKARVNGFYVPLETKLKNLDRLEIITSNKDQTKKNWLIWVVSEKAKSKIKSIFGIKSIEKPKNVCVVPSFKKIKMAECCHPLPGEDVVGIKTTKRKIIVHKKDCKNIQKMGKEKIVEICFERERGQTEIKVHAIDRLGLLAEILEEIKKGGATLTNTSFKIKKTGYVEANFKIEVGSVAKLDNLIEKIEKIPSVQSAERI